MGAVAGNPAGADLAAVRDELAQRRRVLVIDVLNLVLAETANLLLRLAKNRLGHRGAPFSTKARRWRRDGPSETSA